MADYNHVHELIVISSFLKLNAKKWEIISEIYSER